MKLEMSGARMAVLLVAGAAACGSGDDAPADAAGNMPNPGTPTTGEECFADLEAPVSGGFIEVQRFVADGGGLTLWRARRPGDRSAVGETFAYDLVRVWIDSADEDGTCVTDPSAMTYTFGHHNWAETWTVETAYALYTGRETFSVGPTESRWTDLLEAESSNGTVLSTVVLLDEGCESLPYDLNPCLARMRIDEAPEGWGQE